MGNLLQKLPGKIKYGHHSDRDICPICLDEQYVDIVVLKCSHIFHKQCFSTMIELNNLEHLPILCPMCRCKHTKIECQLILLKPDPIYNTKSYISGIEYELDELELDTDTISRLPDIRPQKKRGCLFNCIIHGS